MRGLVIKSTGSSYIVRLDDGRDVECRIKGNFRIRGIRSTNPVAVGDYVQCTKDEGQGTGGTSVYWITEVDERRNYIIRRSTNLSKESHILAANIDQVALIVTVNHPVTNTTFIDRFLATCEAYRVPAILVFNKTDLYDEADIDNKLRLEALYQDLLGYPMVSISAQNNELHNLPDLLQGKVTLFAGNSGVGKSTLLNTLFGKEMARTGHISDAHDKGMHTTTFSEMYFLEDGAIIDTPGIKGFGSVYMEKEEVSHYFREIFSAGNACRYRNCLHDGEPGCAVVKAVEEKKIRLSRYESYLSLLEECRCESKYR